MSLEKDAKKIQEKIGFTESKKIYQADCAQKKAIRNIIYTGKYKNQEAVFKIYDDFRITDEPISLKIFNKVNKSNILKAPELFNYKIINSKKGWLVMERIPEQAKTFKTPLNSGEQREFLNLFLEYKKYFPKKPTRDLLLAENLSSDKFQITRLNKWFLMANDKMVETKNSVLRPQDFIPRFERALDLISKEFRIREKVWIHGHFKPQEIFKISNSEYYLIDFAHTHYYPEGYELAFIIWADWLISADWKLDYNEWRKGVFSWIENLRPVAKKMKIKKYDNLIRASIIERIMGTIMADIYIANKTRQEKELRIKLLYKLFDELI